MTCSNFLLPMFTFYILYILLYWYIHGKIVRNSLSWRTVGYYTLYPTRKTNNVSRLIDQKIFSLCQVMFNFVLQF